MCRGKIKSFLRGVTLSASFNLFLRLIRKLLLYGIFVLLHVRVRSFVIRGILVMTVVAGAPSREQGFCEKGPNLPVTSRSCPPA